MSGYQRSVTVILRAEAGEDHKSHVSQRSHQRLPRTCSEADFLITSVGDCRGGCGPDLAALAPATSLMELRVLVNQVLDWGPEEAWCRKRDYYESFESFCIQW